MQERRAERSANHFPHPTRAVLATKEKKTQRGNKNRGPKENRAPRINSPGKKKKDTGCLNYRKQGY